MSQVEDCIGPVPSSRELDARITRACQVIRDNRD